MADVKTIFRLQSDDLEARAKTSGATQEDLDAIRLYDDGKWMKLIETHDSSDPAATKSELTDIYEVLLKASGNTKSKSRTNSARYFNASQNLLSDRQKSDADTKFISTWLGSHNAHLASNLHEFAYNMWNPMP